MVKPMVKIMLSWVFRFYPSFSPVKVLCNGALDLMIISNSLYDNATFLQIVNEWIYFIMYNINITCAHIGGLIQAEWHVLIRNIGLKIEWRLTDNRPIFEVGLKQPVFLITDILQHYGQYNLYKRRLFFSPVIMVSATNMYTGQWWATESTPSVLETTTNHQLYLGGKDTLSSYFWSSSPSPSSNIRSHAEFLHPLIHKLSHGVVVFVCLVTKAKHLYQVRDKSS